MPVLIKIKSTFVSKQTGSKIGCPAVRDIWLIAADKYLPHVSCPPVNHETTKYTPNDLRFIKDLLVIGNQYFWWASKIGDPGCPGTTKPLLDFRNTELCNYFIYIAMKSYHE
jgi:hypothetical protein